MYKTRVRAIGSALRDPGHRRRAEGLPHARFHTPSREGRALGRFHVLSGAPSSKLEAAQIVDQGRNRYLVKEERPPYGPWDRAPWNGDVEAYRDDLYGGMAFGLPDLPAFAQEWLEELARVGYGGPKGYPPLPSAQRAGDGPGVPGSLPARGEAYPMRFGRGGQVLWLQLDAGRSERGYRNVAVLDEPSRTDRAILAALTSLEGRVMDTERLRGALREVMPARDQSVWEAWVGTSNERAAAGGRAPKPRRVLEDLQHHQTLDYALTILRHHHPGFDDLPIAQRVDVMVEVCVRINGFLDSLRKLVAFLQYGTPGRRGPAASKLADRDVKAAALRDVAGLTYREIGEDLGIPPPGDFAYKGDHPTVRKMVARGRDILEQALGEEGWRRQAEAMRAEAGRWLSMSETEREAELEAEALGIPLEQALQRVEEERGRPTDRSGGQPGDA